MTNSVRMFFPLFLLVFSTALMAEEPAAVDPAKAAIDEKSGIAWYDAKLLTMEGQGFRDIKNDYDRLPARAEGKVRGPVWDLSRQSAGILVRFVTDATRLDARWTLTSGSLAMPHMAATGASGLDLYVRHEGKWRWLACAKPGGVSTNTTIVGGMLPGKREYMLYLPLYNGVKSLQIGIPKQSKLWPAPARETALAKPIVFYGTSITQGACASRPGMCHPAILGRRYDRPVINLGFSGNGRMEPEVVNFIAEIDAAVFVIDCLPNIRAGEVLAQTKPCVEILRKSHPDTPIVLVEDRSYSDGFLVPSRADVNRTSRAALRKVFDELTSSGVKHLYYLEGEQLLGDDNEGTVDASHPTDLGFVRQADAFAEVLDSLLLKEPQ